MGSTQWQGGALSYADSIRGARTTASNASRKSTGLSSREMRPAGPDDPQPYDWIRIIPAPYARCPICHAQSKVADTNGGEFTCWNCGAHAVGVYTNPDIIVNPVYFNYNVFYKSGGPNHKGAVIQSRNDGNAILDQQTQKARFCLAMNEGEKRRAEKELELHRKYPGQRVPDDEYRKINQWMPGLCAAHNVLNLGGFHEIVETTERGTRTHYEPCLSGVPSAEGIPLTCARCSQGIPVQQGLMQWWNPRVGVGKTPKGLLADLESFVDRNVKRYGTDGYEVIVTGYVCTKCGGPLLEVSQSGVDPEHLKLVRDTGVTCPHCGNHDVGREVTHTALYGVFVEGQGIYPAAPGTAGAMSHQVSETGAVRRLNIFDVEFRLHRTGGQLTSELVVDEWRIAPTTRGLVDPYAAVIDAFDFSFLSKWTIQRQAEWMHVADPSKAVAPGSAGGGSPGAPGNLGGQTPPTVPYGG